MTDGEEMTVNGELLVSRLEQVIREAKTSGYTGTVEGDRAASWLADRIELCIHGGVNGSAFIESTIHEENKLLDVLYGL